MARPLFCSICAMSNARKIPNSSAASLAPISGAAGVRREANGSGLATLLGCRADRMACGVQGGEAWAGVHAFHGHPS